MTHVSDNTLIDFIAGTLPDDETQEIEAMLNNDPALCARVETLSVQATSNLAQTVNAAVDGTVDDDVPAAIMDMLREPDTVVDIGAAKKPAPAPNRYFQPAAIAASIAIAAVASLMLLKPAQTGVSLPAHTMTALNTLADGTRAGITMIDESYLNTDGQFCRSFQLEGTAKQIGIACKSNTDWQVVVLVAAPTDTAYFPAGVGADNLLSQYTATMRALEDGAEISYLTK